MMLSFSAEIKMRSGEMGEMRGCCFLCDEEKGDEDRLTQAKNVISQRSRQVVCQWPLSRFSSAPMFLPLVLLGKKCCCIARSGRLALNENCVPSFFKERIITVYNIRDSIF